MSALRRGRQPLRPFNAQTAGRTKGPARFGPINDAGRPGAAACLDCQTTTTAADRAARAA